MLDPTVTNWFDDPTRSMKPVGVGRFGDGYPTSELAANVWCWENSGKYLLAESISPFHPTETFAASNPDRRHCVLDCVGLENANWGCRRHNPRKLELSIRQEPCKFAARTLPTSGRHHQHLEVEQKCFRRLH